MQRPLSPWWRRGALLVLLTGFTILIVMTVLTYRNAPPVPARVVGADGKAVFTGEDVLGGQEVFLKYALMEHGTLWGHGAYLGPDFSAAYLHREAEITRDTIARRRFGREFQDLAPEDRDAAGAVARDVLKANRYDPATGILTYTAGEEASFALQQVEWARYFANGAPGLPAGYIRSADEVRALTAYFAWASWSARANRPGRPYSYTNNWPYEPMAGNGPTAQALVWSGISLMFLLGGLGLILFMFGRFDFLGWQGEAGDMPETTARAAPASPFAPTPSQRVTAWYFVVVAALFLLQVLMGGALAHYRVEPEGFYGYDLARLLPYNLLRSWHLQLAVFWIATAWVAGGLFLAPIIGGREPEGQRRGALALLAALVVVVVGSLFGEYLGINGRLGSLWFWFGHQGSEYLDLGRFWQVLLAAGLVLWLFLMYRAIRPALGDPARREFASLFLAGASGIVIFYLPAFFYGARTNFAIIDNWRFWIIHLWVEGFFELFATVLVAMMFTHMGLVRTRTATRVVYLDAILYLSGGIVGTAHHWYFTGQESIAIALGACFSALEVVPLTLLTLDAWDFIKPEPDSGTGIQGVAHVGPALGRVLPDGRRVLELRRRRRLRVPDQPAHRLVLRGRHDAHAESWPRGHVRRLRHAGTGRARLLPENDADRGAMVACRAVFQGGLLGRQRRARAHDCPQPVPSRRRAAARRRAERLRSRAESRIHDDRLLPRQRVGAHRRRYDVHRPGRDPDLRGDPQGGRPAWPADQRIRACPGHGDCPEPVGRAKPRRPEGRIGT